MDGQMNVPALRKVRNSHVFARSPDEHYAEPAWVSERLFEVLDLKRGSLVLDPACGFGRIPQAAARAGLAAHGRDIVPRWRETPDAPQAGNLHFYPLFSVADVFEDLGDPWWHAIVSNPPFNLAQKVAEALLGRAGMVALLLPTKWVQGDKRSRWLETTPLEFLMPISPRPSMPPGYVWIDGGPVTGGTTDFSWFIWRPGYRGTPQVVHLRRDAS